MLAFGMHFVIADGVNADVYADLALTNGEDHAAGCILSSQVRPWHGVQTVSPVHKLRHIRARVSVWRDATDD